MHRAALVQRWRKCWVLLRGIFTPDSIGWWPAKKGGAMENKQKEDFEIHFMSGSTSREHMRQDVEFVYVMDGRIRMMALGKHFELADGDVMVIDSNHRHSWIEMEKSHVCIIHFNYTMLLSYMEKRLIFFYCNSSMEKGDRYGGIRAIMEDLLSECVVNMERMTFQKKSLLYRLLQYLVTYFMADEVTGTTGDEQIRVEKMLQFINTNYDRTLSLQEMARGRCIWPQPPFPAILSDASGLHLLSISTMSVCILLWRISAIPIILWPGLPRTTGLPMRLRSAAVLRLFMGCRPWSTASSLQAQHEMPAAADENDRQFLKKYIRRNENGIWKSWQTRFMQAESGFPQLGRPGIIRGMPP